MDHQKSKRVPEKHLFLLYLLHQSLCVDLNKLWKILQEMGIPDHLTCLLRNLYTGQEATVRTGHGTIDCFQIGEGVYQGCILSPGLFNSRGTTLWESLVGKPPWKASRKSHRSLDPREGKSDTAATAREEIAHACPQ